MNTMKQQRNSAVELLRILCILMVIAGHYYAHGVTYAVGTFSVENYSLRILLLQMITFGADIANDVFIIITGYYMIHSAVKGKRIWHLIGEMFFYSWIIALIFYRTGLEPFTMESFRDALFPIWSGQSWFVICYIILCLLIPFLNPFLKNLEQRAFVKLLIILFVIRYIAPLLGAVTFWRTSHGLEQFIFLYLVGAYIRLHGFQTKILQNKWSWRILLVITVAIWAVYVAGTGIWGLHTQNNELIANTMEHYLLFSIIISPILVVVVLGMKPFYSKIINAISGSVLAVYLIHDNPMVRNFIWRTVSPNINQVSTNYVFVHMAEKVLLVFIACVLIDQCRIWLLEKPIKKLMSKGSFTER